MTSKKILIVNKFIYPRGGDCIVALSETELLRRAGMDVELWGMSYPDNLPTALSDTFAPEVSFAGGTGARLRAMGRMMGLGSIRKSFKSVLERYRPDVVHFHNIHSYLSPVIVGMAKAAGCRTLWTMHDYKAVCPAYSCLDGEGRPCTECVDATPRSVIKHRCMKGSRLQSLAAAVETWRWDIKTLTAMTDVFICPSRFMASMLRRGGIPEEKIRVIHNHLDPEKSNVFETLPPDLCRHPGKILYVGRLSAEKGVELLLSTIAGVNAEGLGTVLRVYGTGPLESRLRESYGRCPGIEFMGHTDSRGIARALSEATMTVCPSQCYENNPLSVIESLSAGTPVVGAEIGGIPELIRPEDGLLYDPFSADALAGAVKGMLVRRFDNGAIRRSALERFSAEAHLKALMKEIDPL